MRRSVVLCDVDGTLVDSNYHHAIAWSRALHEHGHDVPLNAVHRLIGMGGSQMLERLLGHDDDEISAAWRRHFDELVPEVRALPGAVDLLRGLHDGGATVVIATSSPADLLERLMTLVDAGDAIDAQVTSHDVEEAKPEPDVFSAALDRVGAKPDSGVVIGDSLWDVEAAARAGLPCVGVETGGFSSCELLASGAVAVYRDARDVLERLDLASIPAPS